jgi:hypothetical protein
MGGVGAARIPPETAEFIESGVSVLVGSRDARFEPECVRAVGVRVEDGGTALTVFVPAATGARAIANLRDNGRVAVFFSRAMDHASLQVKGTVLDIADAAPGDRPGIDRQRAALAAALGPIGVPPRWIFRMAHWPAHAVRLRVEQLFRQTPGPGAGAPLGAAGERP